MVLSMVDITSLPLWVLIAGGLLAAVTLAFAIFCLRQVFLFNRRSSEPPVKLSFVPFLGSALSFGVNPVQFLRKCASDLKSDVFTTPFQGRRVHFFTNPHTISTILKNKDVLAFTPIIRDITFSVFQVSADESFLPGAAEVHKILVENIGGSAAVSELTGRFEKYLRGAIVSAETQAGSGWHDGDLLTLVSNTLVAASAAALFGPEFCEVSHALQATTPQKSALGSERTGLVKAFAGFDKLFPLMSAGVPLRLFKSAWAGWKSLVDLAPLDRQRGTVAALIAARNDSFLRAGVSQESAKRLSFAMLWAANGNTVPASYWVLYHIASDPVLREEVVAELKTGLAAVRERTGADDAWFDEPSLRALPTLDAVLTEVLRLYASIFMLREAEADVVLTLPDERQIAVRKGDRVGIFPQLTHFDEEVYDNPMSFQWRRFLPVDGQPKVFFKDGKRLPSTVCTMPFGGGVHMCPGRFFAANEIKLFCASMLLLFDLELTQSQSECKADRSRVGSGVVSLLTSAALRYRLKPTAAAAA